MLEQPVGICKPTGAEPRPKQAIPTEAERIVARALRAPPKPHEEIRLGRSKESSVHGPSAGRGAAKWRRSRARPPIHTAWRPNVTPAEPVPGSPRCASWFRGDPSPLYGGGRPDRCAGFPPPREWRDFDSSVDGVSGVGSMDAVTTFVVRAVGLAGIAAPVGLSPKTAAVGEPCVGPRISASPEEPAMAAGATWAQILGPYRTPNVSRSVLELAVTAAPFVLLWALMWAALGIGYWLCLLLAIPTACFLMRLFMIQHDCGHGACFKRRSTNDWVGRTIGVVTLTPYAFWLRAHALHHANAGNLDHRGSGDIYTMTTDEYAGLTPLRRFIYRWYRSPYVMFGLIPTYLFVVHNRLPFGQMRAGRQPWSSTMGTNAAIAGVVALMIWLIGLWPFLLVQGPVVVLSATIAVWFFYVQHQFEDTLWEHDGEWSFHEAALHGSSHYELPPPLAWFTGNIGVHHVHHLSSRIPFYRLPEVLRDHPRLASVGRLTFAQSFRCVRLALWDERRRRLMTFRELRLEKP